MASSSSGEGSSSTGGRSEPAAQHSELAPVTMSAYTRANDLALRGLVQAVMVGATKFAESLREAGLDAAVAAVAYPNSKRFGPLHVAASTCDCNPSPNVTGFYETVKYLVLKGADCICQDGDSPLQVAALHGHARRVLLMNSINTAIVYLLEVAKAFLGDFDGAAVGKTELRDSSFWAIIQICSYSRWIVNSSLSANHTRLWFSKVHGITPRLNSSNACPIMNQIKKQSMLPPIESTKPRNTVTLCFDGSIDEFKESYRRAIEAIRLWCYANGKRVNLSKSYGRNHEVYTTPAGGNFYLTLKYKGRYIVLSLAGRDLYLMGWRSEHGTFELKPDSQIQQYMADDSCVILNIPKNYGLLSKGRKVGSTWMGPIALQSSFEVLHQCQGLVSDELKRAIARFAVHFSEAARIQDVFNDSCSSFEFEVSELDSKNKTNSFWVNNYDDMSEIAMSRADFVDKGGQPPPLDIPEVQVKSEIDIFKQLRILPRDAYKLGIFKTEERENPIYEGPLDDDSSETESNNKLSRRERRERRKNERKERRKKDPSKGGEDRGYPSFPSFSLLEDWSDAELEEADDHKNIKEEPIDWYDDELEEEEDQDGTEEEGDTDLEEKDDQDMTKAQKDHLKRKPEINDADRGFDDYLDHFSLVRKIIDIKTITQNLQSAVMIDRPVSQHFDPYEVTKPKLKGFTLSAGNCKHDFVTHFRKPQAPLLQANGIFQRNVFKVCSVMTRVLRFI